MILPKLPPYRRVEGRLNEPSVFMGEMKEPLRIDKAMARPVSGPLTHTISAYSPGNSPMASMAGLESARSPLIDNRKRLHVELKAAVMRVLSSATKPLMRQEISPIIGCSNQTVGSIAKELVMSGEICVYSISKNRPATYWLKDRDKKQYKAMAEAIDDRNRLAKAEKVNRMMK